MAGWVGAEDDFEHPPISYHTSPSHDPVAQLLERLKAGTEKLEPDSNGSYLRSLLKALKIPESSQCLVFSKTSMQIPYIQTFRWFARTGNEVHSKRVASNLG